MHSWDHLSYGITQCYMPPDRDDSHITQLNEYCQQLDNIKCTVLRYSPTKMYHDLETLVSRSWYMTLLVHGTCWSPKVTENDIIPQVVYDFLLMFCSITITLSCNRWFRKIPRPWNRDKIQNIQDSDVCYESNYFDYSRWSRSLVPCDDSLRDSLDHKTEEWQHLLTWLTCQRLKLLIEWQTPRT